MQRTGADGGGARVSIRARKNRFTRTRLSHRTRTRNSTANREISCGIAVKNQGRVVNHCATSKRSGCAAVTYLQRTGADGGGTRVGVGSGEGGGSATGLCEGTCAADDIGNCKRITAVDR